MGMSEDAVVLSTKGASAAAGLAIGSRVCRVHGVVVSTKAEVIACVKRLQAAGTVSMILTVEPSSMPKAGVTAAAAAPKPSPPEHFTVIKYAKLRAGAAPTSKECGELNLGDAVQVLERTTVSGKVRLRTDKGWLSEVSSKGAPFLAV